MITLPSELATTLGAPPLCGGTEPDNGISPGSADLLIGIARKVNEMGNCLPLCRNRVDSGSGFWTAEACLRVLKLRNPGSALQSGAVAPRHYRRIADDDPIEDPLNPGNPNPDREVKITFKQPKPGKFAIQNYQVYEFYQGLWTNRTFIDPDPNHEYMEWDLKQHMPEERAYEVKLKTMDVNNTESEDGPEVRIIIDASSPEVD